jgi:hypothetical protein
MKITLEVLKELGFKELYDRKGYQKWNAYSEFFIKEDTDPMGVSGWFLELEKNHFEHVTTVTDIFSAVYHQGYDDGKKKIQEEIRKILNVAENK